MCSNSWSAHCYTHWRTPLVWWSVTRGRTFCICIRGHACVRSFLSTSARSLRLAPGASISRIAAFLTVSSDQSVAGFRRASIWCCYRSWPSRAQTKLLQHWSFRGLCLAMRILRCHPLFGRLMLPHIRILWSSSWLLGTSELSKESRSLLFVRLLAGLSHCSY